MGENSARRVKERKQTQSKQGLENQGKRVIHCTGSWKRQERVGRGAPGKIALEMLCGSF